VPDPAVDTPLPVSARSLPEAEAARRTRDAELHACVFGHPVRFVASLGEWEYEGPSSVGGRQWYPVPGYGVFAEMAERLRTRVAERGYEVGLFREAAAGPRFAAPPAAARGACCARAASRWPRRGARSERRRRGLRAHLQAV
jgi:hypothetical protein